VYGVGGGKADPNGSFSGGGGRRVRSRMKGYTDVGMGQMSPRAVEAAWRVLACLKRGASPDPYDARAVRSAVPSTQPELPLNVVASYVVDQAAAPAPSSAMGAQSQRALVQNLYAQLDLAFTLVRTAQIGLRSDPDGCLSAASKAGMALQQVRHFSARVRDRDDWARIQERADALEAALSSTKHSWNPE
jgi:hypothetical protein